MKQTFVLVPSNYVDRLRELLAQYDEAATGTGSAREIRARILGVADAIVKDARKEREAPPARQVSCLGCGKNVLEANATWCAECDGGAWFCGKCWPELHKAESKDELAQGVR